MVSKNSWPRPKVFRQHFYPQVTQMHADFQDLAKRKTELNMPFFAAYGVTVDFLWIHQSDQSRGIAPP